MDEPHRQERAQTALVLDDEFQVGALVCRVLATNGITAKQFTEPLSFLLEVKRSAPDLLILDLALGRSDAIDVIRKLEVLKFPGAVLLLSGRDELTLREIERIGTAHGLAMLPSLQKPFRAVEFKTRLQALATRATKAVESDQPPSPRIPPEDPHMILEQALQQNFLELWYQPKIALKSLSICGAEALIRARHPIRGILCPVDILPPPGDPLYKQLSMFVIHRAISDWQIFVAKGRPLKLAINVPASVLSAPGFVNFVRSALPADPEFPGLIVEVTEDEAIRDMSWIQEVATQLKIYNVWISIDDFGSAYASLSRLKDLPFREVKLDRSFVTNCATDTLKRSLCRTVVDLAHCFGAAACAEGVETTEDLHCLIGLGFDTAQGFLFAKPMPFTRFLEFIAVPQGGFGDMRPLAPQVPAKSAKA